MLLGRTDFIPIDSYALKMVSKEFHGGEPVGPQEVSGFRALGRVERDGLLVLGVVRQWLRWLHNGN